ncbi:MAG TPA: ATP-dependent DNA helicase [Mycobacterium sp.]|nr:ATP-dependent DNA helicase [Mycobacterium sp.]
MTGAQGDAVRFSPAELADALGLPAPTAEQAAVIAAPPGPLVVVAGAGAGKTETMAARVVWLVANGYATPDQVLGLTFTRKAAGQLLRRVRSRLGRLAGHLGHLSDGPMPDGHAADRGSPTVSTYHAFAGALLREFGLLLPVEPDARLLGDTEMWQLAYDVVRRHPGPLPIDKTPAAVTAMVRRLHGELAEHLVGTADVLGTHAELERLVLTLPPGPRQRDAPNRRLLDLLDAQSQRSALVPLVDALIARMRADRVMDFGSQMSAAARLAAGHPEVGEQLRERYRVVLLDEYQDTGHSQRIALSALFGPRDGSSAGRALALTAVGDPIQSIYGWRGASATNLPRFTTDFPCADGSPAPTSELSTSWRNPPRVLELANAISAEARRRSVGVRPLQARPGAESGTVRCALLGDVVAERRWLADAIAARYTTGGDGQPPTAAVLVRRNADAGPIAAELTARGIPVEVVGLSGLLSIPEVAQVLSTLRLVADPSAGAAAMAVLTGPRWRLGAADLAALWRRAVVLEGRRSAATTAAEVIAAVAEPDTAGLADALADPGAPEAYSVEGYRRITACAAELTRLRAGLSNPVTELVAEIRRVIGIDAEVAAARPPDAPGTGTEHLDRFTEVVARYSDHAGVEPAGAEHAGNAVTGLLAYLDAAAVVENGLAPAEVSTAPGRVQILTVHAAKGLEWQIVAVPHLSGRVFPSTGTARTWLNDPAELPPLLRGDRADAEFGAGLHGVPVLDTSAVTDRKALEDVIDAHREQLQRRRIDEERRLLYVALTRSEDTLLLSGHHWGETGAKPRGPSEFLTEIREIIDATGCGEIEEWAPGPADGEPNPLSDTTVEVSWPVDPLRGRRGDVQRGADLVAAAMAGDPGVPDGSDEAAVPDDVDDWVAAITADVDALLAERARASAPRPVRLPPSLSVSALVELDRDPRAAARLARRLPARPDPHALLGTAFHDWVQRFFGADRLFDLDDLPGAGDTRGADAEALEELQEAFRASEWAARTPLAVEVPFEMTLTDQEGADQKGVDQEGVDQESADQENTVVRGRIDAVFSDPDGGVTVVDWKTGEPPTGAARQHAAVQLAVYRLAWAALAGVPESRVRAVFHYVRAGRTVAPDTLYGREELAALLTSGGAGEHPAGSAAR